MFIPARCKTQRHSRAPSECWQLSRKLEKRGRNGIDPDELKDLLRRAGLELVEDLGADDYRSRYWGGACSRWRGYRFYRAALAIVPAHAEA